MKKYGILFLTLVFLCSTLSLTISPINAQAQVSNKTQTDVVTFEKEFNKLIVTLEKMVSKGIDFQDLKNNNNKKIQSLTTEEKKVYQDYKSYLENPENQKSDSLNSRIIDNGEISTLAKKASGIYISQKQIQRINDVSGFSGGIIGVATALIKMKLGLSPTALTMLILAVASLGIGGLNLCNKYKKGVYLKGEFIGSIYMPMGTVSCVAKK
ncbi:hypothetical protein [Bacillus altitudinis]|nr:hypothetical protein [Bacillus altitudinis]MEC1184478.1 hypothetical protein [Bacillus altitudinis]